MLYNAKKSKGEHKSAKNMRSSIFRAFKFIIIIAIIICIGVVAFKYIKEMFVKKVDNDVKTDLLLVQAKIKLIKGKSDVKDNTEDFIGKKVSESENEDIKNLLKTIEIEESKFDKYYILAVQDFETMGIRTELKNVEDNLYIVNYEDGEIIYTKGITIDNKVEYKVSNILEEIDNQNQDQEKDNSVE